MDTERDLLRVIAADPGDDLAWLALADVLEDAGQTERAELVRLREWLRHAAVDDPQRPPRQARLQALLAAGVRPAGPRWRLVLPGSIPLDMSLIPPGSFSLGSPPAEPHRQDDEALHRVYFPSGFWLGIYPVTLAQWQAIEGSIPSRHPAPEYPVEQIDWHQAMYFCQRLGQRLGGSFTLPTEARWEYACRAGTTSVFHSGDDEAALARAGWYAGNSGRHPHAVGQKEPNAWGLFDMHGNVMEWCLDGRRPSTSTDTIDPEGPRHGSAMIRGGCHVMPASRCRSAYRDSYPRGIHSPIAGFRLLRKLDATGR